MQYFYVVLFNVYLFYNIVNIILILIKYIITQKCFFVLYLILGYLFKRLRIKQKFILINFYISDLLIENIKSKCNIKKA